MQPYDHKGNYLQSTDWMALSILFDDELPHEAPPDHFWQVYEHGTAVWHHRAILFNKYGESVLTLLAKPKVTSVLHERAGIVEVSNEWLYHGIGVGGALDLLHWCCHFQVTGISRLDLCMDFQPTLEQSDIIIGLSEKRYYVQGKRNRVEFCSSPKDAWVPEIWQGFCPHQQAWGHKTSQVKWKLYYKSKELRDNGGGWFAKPYIVDGWRHFGLDENNVWRLEVSMHNCNSLLCDYDEITFSKWAANELKLFTSMYATRFIVRRAEQHADKSNDAVIPFLPISTSSKIRCKKYESDTGHSARIALLRQLVKFGGQEEVYIDSKASRALCDHVESIVMNDGLGRYFQSMVGMSLGQWVNMMVGRRGDKCLLQNALPENTDIQPNINF